MILALLPKHSHHGAATALRMEPSKEKKHSHEDANTNQQHSPLLRDRQDSPRAPEESVTCTHTNGHPQPQTPNFNDDDDLKAFDLDGLFFSSRRHAAPEFSFSECPFQTPPRSHSPPPPKTFHKPQDAVSSVFTCIDSHQKKSIAMATPSTSPPKASISLPSKSKKKKPASKSSRKRSVKAFKLSTSNRTKRQAVPRHLRKINRSAMTKSPKKPTDSQMPSLETHKRAKIVRRRPDHFDFKVMH
ncbi:hypothetical protein AAMO2058_001551300 [Amorphochlora amoebiformis]